MEQQQPNNPTSFVAPGTPQNPKSKDRSISDLPENDGKQAGRNNSGHLPKQHSSTMKENDADPPDDETSSVDPTELPLVDCFTLWHAGKKQGKGGSKWVKPKSIATFNTVGGFWRLFNNLIPPSQLQSGADMHLFKEGIEPEWEHRGNIGGGTWTVNLHSTEKSFFDHLWTTLVLLFVGQNFEQHENVCGIVASVRPRKLRIALWINAIQNQDKSFRRSRANTLYKTPHYIRAIGHLVLNACSQITRADHEQKTLNYSQHDTGPNALKISLRCASRSPERKNQGRSDADILWWMM